MTTSSSEKLSSFNEDVRRANVTTLFVLIKYLFGVYILQNDYFHFETNIAHDTTKLIMTQINLTEPLSIQKGSIAR